MTINPILAIIAVIVFVFGLIGSVATNVMFLIKARKSIPEIYKTKSIVWKDAKVIQDAITRLDDESLSRLYKLSREVPALSIIIFGVLVIVIIVTAQ